ncbi:histidinol-phosphate transaminase [Nocardia sp. NBC_00416]|uniref:histidinol-phosphate transaminase n=1 Tax=Nocardia sp. NBC_00416 TaxID=2975991 RepID=UPI003FA61079
MWLTVADGGDVAGGDAAAPLGSWADPADLPVRANLRAGTPYGAPQLSEPVRLNTNESPYPPSAELVNDIAERVRTAAAELHRYPDREATALRADLSGYLGLISGVAVNPANVWPANGSSEILQQLLLVFGGHGRRALGFGPSYSMYRIIAEYLGTEWIEVPRAADFSLDAVDAVAAIAEHRPDIVFVTNPDSPSGRSTDRDELEQIVRAAPGIVVVDEAYGEFSTTPTAIGLIDRFPTKLVVTRTLSKAFGFAGVRVGYLVAAPVIVDAVQLVRLPYHVSTISQVAARAALAHTGEILDNVAAVVRERERVRTGLRELGFEVFGSAGNFLLFGRFTDASRAWLRFLDHDVLIRDVGTPQHLRVTIGTRAENERFLEVCAEIGDQRYGLLGSGGAIPASSSTRVLGGPSLRTSRL